MKTISQLTRDARRAAMSGNGTRMFHTAKAMAARRPATPIRCALPKKLQRKLGLLPKL